jgi:hypothetical protein
METCNLFTDYLAVCQDTIKINAALEPAVSYRWVITDKFDKEYSGVNVSDGEGALSISVTDLPPGLLTSYSGDFRLRLFKNDEECKAIRFLMAQYYDEVCFYIKAGTREKNNLGCEFDCVSSGGGSSESAIFPFTDEETVHIEWSNLLSSFYGDTPQVQVYHETSPGVFALASVTIEQNLSGYSLESIDIDNGGPATGYVLVS